MASTPRDPEIPLHPIPDTGAMLRAYFKKHRIYQSALGRALGRDYDAVNDYKKRTKMLTSTLWQISVALRHNFFADIAAQMPKEYPTDAPVDDTKDRRINELETELMKVRAERDLLKEMFGKG